jgi:acetylornithine deacetylase
MDDLDKVLARIDGGRLADLLVDAVDHYSPTFAEVPALRVFAAALERADLSFRRQPVPCGTGDLRRANLILTLGPDPVALLWVGHVDTVSLWHDGGHAARRAGDVIHGLGTADMKGGCSAMLEAVTAVKESGVPLRQGVAVALVVGEEEYGDGSKALVDRVNAPVVIVGEPTSLRPCLSHFGYMEARLVSRCPRRHAALAEPGGNAIEAMLEWILAIYHEVRGLPMADRVAINPRKIQGGESGFVTAPVCETVVDIHLPPALPLERMESVLEAARRTAMKENADLELQFERLYWAPGFDDKDRIEAHRLALLRSAFKAARVPWRPEAFRSHSDASFFRERGALTLVCGPGDLSVAHSRAERVSLREVERAARLYAALILSLCGAS